MPDKIAVIAGHELQLLEEMIPSEVMQLDEITLEIMSPRQIIDVNLLLHVNQALLLREQRSY
jgi:hypothetical protein